MNNDSNMIYETTDRIETIDCDFNQQPKPAALFRHLSEAAGTHATRLGVGFEAMVARGLTWVHARMKVRITSYPHAGDTITIRTWPKAIERRLLYIRDFDVLDADGKRIAAATSAWLVVDAASHRIVRPGSVDLKVPAVTGGIGLDEPLDQLKLELGDDDGCLLADVRAGYSAIDILGHVNNSRYVEWICDGFPLAMFREHRLDWLQINYLHEVLPEENVTVRLARTPEDSDLWAAEGLNRTNGTRAFEALVHWRD